MLEKLKNQVRKTNLVLVENGLVVHTWGNVSGIDRESGLVVIKPSGMSYEKMSPDDMELVNLNNEVVEGTMRPSTDSPTHIEIYKSFTDIGGIVHTHSAYAMAFAQAGLPIPALGTTHADCFFGNVPCTRELKENEIWKDYESNTGVILETITCDILAIPLTIMDPSYGEQIRKMQCLTLQFWKRLQESCCFPY